VDAWELYQKIQQSEGMKIYWRMQELQASFSIFSGNLEEMIEFGSLIEQLYSSPKPGVEEKKQALHTAHRRLHNFLAGANTLIDHTRVLVNDLYGNTPFFLEYEEEKRKSFVESPIAGFIKGLRNWMVHRGPVPLCVVSKLGIAAEVVISRLMLDVNDMQAWDKWDSRARAFLAGLEKHAPLKELLVQYASIVETFYGWFRIRLNEVHFEAFRALNEMQALYRQLSGERAASQIE
jgi:hypothetical protein